MKKTNVLTFGIILLLGAALLAGCPKKKPAPVPEKPAPATQKPAAGQPTEPEVTVVPPGKEQPGPGEHQTEPPQPGEGEPQFPDNIDDPYQPPEYEFENDSPGETTDANAPGSVSGKVLLGESTPRNGNLFIYIPDIDSVNKAQPRSLASQIITADRINDSIVEFNLTGVPAGEYMILAVWDISEPHCDMTDAMCAISAGQDRLGQSDLVKVMPGLKTQGVVIAMTSNEIM